jgi:hypothetical protein
LKYPRHEFELPAGFGRAALSALFERCVRVQALESLVFQGLALVWEAIRQFVFCVTHFDV